MGDFISRNIIQILGLLAICGGIIYKYGQLNSRVVRLEDGASKQDEAAKKINDILTQMSRDIEVIKNNISWILKVEAPNK